MNAFLERVAPQDLEAAIAIQDDLARLIGQNVVGWKVGGELVGRVFEPNLLRSPAALPENQYGHASVIVVAELGFRLLTDLPARSAAFGSDELAEHIVLVPAIEIGGTRFKERAGNIEVRIPVED